MILELIVVTAWTTWISFIAQETVTPSSTFDWVQLGLAGLVIGGFMTRQIVTGKELREVKEELKEARAENHSNVQMHLETQLKTLPALDSGNQVLKEVLDELKLSRAERDKDRLERYGRDLRDERERRG